MRPPKYPLHALAEYRERRIDEASHEVAGAARDREAAEKLRAASERRRAAHAAEAERVRAAEAGALARAELTVADLARGEAWSARSANEQEMLVSEVNRAREEVDRTSHREERARGDLALRTADAQVVAEDRVRWRDGQRKRAEAKEEESTLEAWRPPRA